MIKTTIDQPESWPPRQHTIIGLIINHNHTNKQNIKRKKLVSWLHTSLFVRKYLFMYYVGILRLHIYIIIKSHKTNVSRYYFGFRFLFFEYFQICIFKIIVKHIQNAQRPCRLVSLRQPQYQHQQWYLNKINFKAFIYNMWYSSLYARCLHIQVDFVSSFCVN